MSQLTEKYRASVTHSPTTTPFPSIIRICVLGETVGKSCLIYRFLNKSFAGKHISHNLFEEIYDHKILLLNKIFNIKITDTTNNHLNKSNHNNNNNNLINITLSDIDNYSINIYKQWIIRNNIFYLLFNRLNKISWLIIKEIHKYIIKLLNNNYNIPIYIISTCSDLYKSSNRQSTDLVSLKEVQKYVSKHINVYYYETSSKLNENIDTLFESSIIKYYKLNQNKQIFKKPRSHTANFNLYPNNNIKYNKKKKIKKKFSIKKKIIKKSKNKNKPLPVNKNKKNDNINIDDDIHDDNDKKQNKKFHARRRSSMLRWLQRAKLENHDNINDYDDDYDDDDDDDNYIMNTNQLYNDYTNINNNNNNNNDNNQNNKFQNRYRGHSSTPNLFIDKQFKNNQKPFKNKSKTAALPLRPSSTRISNTNNISTKKEYKQLQKQYRKHSPNVNMKDILSSDDDGVVLINTNNSINNYNHSAILISPQTVPLKRPSLHAPSKSLPDINIDDNQTLTIITDEYTTGISKDTNNNSDKKQYNSNDTIYSGFLWKQGKIVKSWKLRYFIFCGDYQLRYYTSSALENLKGIADLTPSNVVSVDIDRTQTINNDIDNDINNAYPFIIFCKNRTWKFRARTARERQQWVEMIKSVVIAAKKDDKLPPPQKLTKSKSMWKTFLDHSPLKHTQSSSSAPTSPFNGKHTKTLLNADDNEDAMDIFGISQSQYLYTLHIYCAKNIPRGKELTEPNVYISIEYNQCKSGNKYQTNIIYNSMDPIFNEQFVELADKNEIDNITLTVKHRSLNSNNDEIIGSIVLNINTFNSWDKWLWLPVISESEKHFQTYISGSVYYDDIKSYTGMVQLKLEHISLDDAIVLHQSKLLHEYSHIISLHIHDYIPYDYSKDINNNDIKLPPNVKFMYPLLQIQWKYDEIFSTQFAQKIHNNDNQTSIYRWNESHYIYAQLRNDDKKSHLKFNILNDEIETGNDIIGEGKMSWKEIKKIEKNEIRTLKIPIFARRIILQQDIQIMPSTNSNNQQKSVIQMYITNDNLASDNDIDDNNLTYNDNDDNDDNKNNNYLSTLPIGYIHIDIEILSKKQIFQEFYRKLFTLHWIKKVNDKTNHNNNNKNKTNNSIIRKSMAFNTAATFTPNQIYSILLSIGIHPSDAEYHNWVKTFIINDDDDDDDDNKDDDNKQVDALDNIDYDFIQIPMDDVISLVLNNKYETSVSLNHYISAYLNFKNSKKFMKLPTNIKISKHHRISSKYNNNINIQQLNQLNKNKMMDPMKSVNNIIDSGWWVRFDRNPLYAPDKDDLFVMDRSTGNKIREHVPGYIKIALKLQYDGWMLRISPKNISKHLNIFAANKSCKFDSPSSSLLISPFIKLHHINMNDYIDSNISSYNTFNEFFQRNLRIISVPNKNETIIVSPCNGKLICFDNFRECSNFWVKGSKFNVQKLIGNEMYKTLLLTSQYNITSNLSFSLENLNKLLQNGNKIEYKKKKKEFSNKFSITIIRLSPYDYHGYHYPFNAKVISISSISGALYSVSPIVVNRDVNVLTENKRCCILFENQKTFGLCCMIVVSSFLIGSYTINCKIGQYVNCGELLGKFKYGGSCVILLFNKNKIKFNKDLISNSLSRTRVETIVKLNESIANVIIS